MTISQLPHPLVASAWLVAALAMTPPAEAQTSLDFISEQGPTVDRIVKDALSQPRAHARLVTLCDRHGHRLSGSPGLEAALDWAVTTMRAEGHANVGREEVEVPQWIRGSESATVLTPRRVPLAMLGLGNSVGTPPEGIQAEVVTVATEKELKALGESVRGKIVLFNNPMPKWTTENGPCYGETVQFRVNGPSMAATQGAVGVLVRSVTARSLRTPHTGTLFYQEGTTRLPAAAISTEDADFIARRQAAGETVTVDLRMDAHWGDPVKSANVVAELRGRELPEEIVIVSGHMDSWDVGQGAHDDGSGVVMAMETIAALKRLGIQPRRTIRVVLWTNEENGMAGAKQYLKSHAAELPNHVAAIEADLGGFAPSAFGVKIADEAKQSRAVVELETLLGHVNRHGVGATGDLFIKPGASAPDVYRFANEGVPAIGLYTHDEHYFDYHHTEADTVDKVDPEELARSTAALTVLTWLVAEMPTRLGAEEGAASH
jgi:hypothetical protein